MHYHESILRSLPKTAPRWGTGIWFGRSEESNRHMLLTLHGAISDHEATNRTPMGSRELRRVRGLPWSVREGVEDAQLEEIPRQMHVSVPVEGKVNEDGDKSSETSLKVGSSSSSRPDPKGSADVEGRAPRSRPEHRVLHQQRRRSHE